MRRALSFASFLVAALVAACGIPACGSGGGGTGGTSGTGGVTGTGPDMTVINDHCTVTLTASTDAPTNHLNIENALGNAKTGDVVCLSGGTYPVLDELSLATDGVELRGTSDGTAVLDFKGQTLGANGISVTANGFKLTHITVKNTAGDAVRVTKGQNVAFTGVTVTWDAGPVMTNGAYGLYPVQCTGVLIDGCTVSYAADAGIYVGQSTQILVKNSEAFGNVAGIEIENSTDAEVTGCYSHDNTGGILVFNLPALQVGDGKRANVHGNRVFNNNGSNFASPSGIVSHVPTGTGMFIMASDHNELHDNDINGNDSIGIAVVSYLILQMPYTDATYDPFPQGNYIHDNRFDSDGAYPSGIADLLAAMANYMVVPDLVWDGIVDPSKSNADGSLTNCFDSNGTATFGNLGIDAAGKFHPSTDITPFNCTGIVLPSITPTAPLSSPDLGASPDGGTSPDGGA